MCCFLKSVLCLECVIFARFLHRTSLLRNPFQPAIASEIMKFWTLFRTCLGSLGGRRLLLLERVHGPAQDGRVVGHADESRMGRARVGRLAHPDAAEAEAPPQPDLRGASGGSVLGHLPLSMYIEFALLNG